MITAVLADEHALFRAGLARLLQTQSIQVVAETHLGVQTVELVHKKRPQLAMISLTLVDHSGLEVIHSLRQAYPHLALLALAPTYSQLVQHSATRAGANAVVSKTHDLHQLVQTIQILAQQPRTNPRLQRRQEKFISLRQLRILRALTSGNTNEQIARSLNFSRSTIKAELRQLFDTFATQDRGQLVSQAARHGLIGVSPV